MGAEAHVKAAITALEGIKGEKPIDGLIGNCEACRYACRLAGTKASELPLWVRG